MKHDDAKGFVDRFFKDKHNKWAVIQWPNVLLWAWILLSIVVFFVHDAAFRGHLNLLRSAILFAWAYLEATEGDSYFRRVLGVIILCVTIANFLF